MSKVLEQIEKYILYAVIFLLPITFASIAENPFVPAKLTLLVFGIGTIFIIKSIRTILDGKFTWAVSSLDFPVILLAVSYIVSAYFKTPNKMEAILFPGTTTAVVSASLLYFLINQLGKNEKIQAVKMLFVSGVVFSILTILAGLKLFANASVFPAFMRSSVFTPTGGYLPAALFLATLLPIGISLALKHKDIVRQSSYAVASVVILFGLGFAVFNLVPNSANLARGTGVRSSGLSTSWSVSVDSLKESPLLGSGPANYFTSFTRFRPLSYNQTNNWRFKFATAQNYYLTVLTETGMLGVAGIAILLLALYRVIRHEIVSDPYKILLARPSTLSLAILLFILLFFPASTFIMVLLFILLALSMQSSPTALNLASVGENHKRSNLPALIISIPTIILVGYVFVKATTIIRAEYTYKQSLDAIAANNGIESYDYLRSAISINPYVDRYHSRYSQVNLALANSLAGQAVDGQLTEEQRTQITQLVQQAIREARLTVQLNPLRSNGWEQLARTYQAIIPLAQGADTFASQSYRQAIALDPTNANLRIALGQLHFAAKDYEGAITIFNTATQVKPDLANAYFNLAFAYREAGKIDLAKTAMTNAIANIDKTSADYAVALQALDDLDKFKNQTPPATSELEAPTTEETPVIDPKLELTQEDTPPEAPLSPTPSPTADAETAPSISPVITPTPLP